MQLVKQSPASAELLALPEKRLHYWRPAAMVAMMGSVWTIDPYLRRYVLLQMHAIFSNEFCLWDRLSHKCGSDSTNAHSVTTHVSPVSSPLILNIRPRVNPTWQDAEFRDTGLIWMCTVCTKWSTVIRIVAITDYFLCLAERAGLALDSVDYPDVYSKCAKVVDPAW